MNMLSTCNGSSKVVILAVDDDQDNLVLLGYQLSLLLPCSVISASNGQTALLLAKQFHPDLILLDIMLPDMDGFEIVRQLKQDSQTCKIPVIAVSAMARSQDQETALQAGYDDYLLKPYELESLEALIYRYLNFAYPLSS
ncbi:response regulator [Leptothermofonsia sichuanensis E412]|nr:response regulator [Leptothermofonsia sichuanensis E412]